MDYNISPNYEKAREAYQELNADERRKFIREEIIGNNFDIVGSWRILPRGQVRKDLGAEVRMDDID